jgi:hypothetical protein
MASLDVAIVNVASPAIEADLGASGAALQLIVAGCAVVYATLLVVGARLGADHGQRTAAAAMAPQVMSSIRLAFDGPARSRALVLQSTIVSAGVVVGLVLGGALVSADILGTSLDLGLLRRGPVARGTVALTAQMVAYGGFLFSLTLYLQQGQRYSALECGLTFAPYALGFAATSLAMPSLPEHETRWLVPLGLAAAAAAYAALGVGGWDLGVELPLLAVAGAGFGAGFTPAITRTVTGLPPANAPDASGLITTNVQLSYALGVSTIGSAFLGARVDSFAGVAVACGVLALVAAGLSALPGRRLVAASQLSS